MVVRRGGCARARAPPTRRPRRVTVLMINSAAQARRCRCSLRRSAKQDFCQPGRKPPIYCHRRQPDRQACSETSARSGMARAVRIRAPNGAMVGGCWESAWHPRAIAHALSDEGLRRNADSGAAELDAGECGARRHFVERHVSLRIETPFAGQISRTFATASL